jgi:hypothetical protein
LKSAYLDRDIFTSQEKIEVKWPKKIQHKAFYQTTYKPQKRIYAQSQDRGRTSDPAFLGHSASLVENNYEVVLMPVAREYYEENIRITSKLPIWVTGNHPYSNLQYGSFDERRKEAFELVLQDGRILLLK